MQGNSPYIKATEAHTYGIGLSAWYRLIRSGQIKSIKLGRKFVVPRAAFLAWYESAGQSTPASETHKGGL